MKHQKKRITAIVVGMLATSVFCLWSFAPYPYYWRCEVLGVLNRIPDHTEYIRLWLLNTESERQSTIRQAIDLHATETGNLYLVEYALQAESVAHLLRLEGPKTILKADKRFDLNDCFVAYGVPPHEGSSAIIDTNRRSLVVVNSGSNLALIVTLLSPLFPVKYEITQIPH